MNNLVQAIQISTYKKNYILYPPDTYKYHVVNYSEASCHEID